MGEDVAVILEAGVVGLAHVQRVPSASAPLHHALRGHDPFGFGLAKVAGVMGLAQVLAMDAAGTVLNGTDRSTDLGGGHGLRGGAVVDPA